MIKGINKIGCLSFLLLMFLACQEKNNNTQHQSTLENKNNFQYLYDNGSTKLNVEVKKVPQKAVLFSHFMTEMLLALGLEDKIVLGTTEGEILPEFKKAYDKVPNKIIGHHAIMTKEAFLLLNPDFVSGWDEAVRAEATGTAEEIYSKGIYPFTVKSVRNNETLDTVYEDFLTLGKIFAVEAKAEEVVNKMKDKLAKAQASFVIKPENEKKKVLVFSSVENGIYVSGGLTTDLIKRAGGKNVYEELGADHELVSFESLIHRNPDIIFIAHMAEGLTYDQKVDFLKKHPALKNLPAVKTNNIHKIALEDISPGVRNTDFIIKMNQLMYAK
jgi:iron complex transport system substrate-binding protein